MKLFIYIFALAALSMADESNNEIFRQGNNQFTAKMFSEIVKQNPTSSVVLSAFSVLSPLAQLALASEGESHDEILKTIGFPNDNMTKAIFADLTRKLRSIQGVELKTANKIYIRQGQELNESFAAVSRDVFASEVKNVNFDKNVETANEINTWVEEQTNHRIKNLVDPKTLGADTRAVLVNAIYFKGTWKHQFSKKSTTDRNFHISKDNTIKVPTMYNKGNYKYGESSELNAKLLEIPYVGEETSMLIVLPNETDGLAALEEKLKDPLALARAQERMYSVIVEVHLPKFKIQTTTQLNDVLINMGIKRLFSPEAKLNNLVKGKNDVYLSAAIQKAFIEVTEEGTEATAANEFVFAGLSALIPLARVFDADHPFAFFLKQKKNILFNGVFVS